MQTDAAERGTHPAAPSHNCSRSLLMRARVTQPTVIRYSLYSAAVAFSSFETGCRFWCVFARVVSLSSVSNTLRERPQMAQYPLAVSVSQKPDSAVIRIDFIHLRYPKLLTHFLRGNFCVFLKVYMFDIQQLSDKSFANSIGATNNNNLYYYLLLYLFYCRLLYFSHFVYISYICPCCTAFLR